MTDDFDGRRRDVAIRQRPKQVQTPNVRQNTPAQAKPSAPKGQKSVQTAKQTGAANRQNAVSDKFVEQEDAPDLDKAGAQDDGDLLYSSRRATNSEGNLRRAQQQAAHHTGQPEGKQEQEQRQSDSDDQSKHKQQEVEDIDGASSGPDGAHSQASAALAQQGDHRPATPKEQVQPGAEENHGAQSGAEPRASAENVNAAKSAAPPQEARANASEQEPSKSPLRQESVTDAASEPGLLPEGRAAQPANVAKASNNDVSNQVPGENGLADSAQGNMGGVRAKASTAEQNAHGSQSRPPKDAADPLQSAKPDRVSGSDGHLPDADEGAHSPSPVTNQQKSSSSARPMDDSGGSAGQIEGRQVEGKQGEVANSSDVATSRATTSSPARTSSNPMANAKQDAAQPISPSGEAKLVQGRSTPAGVEEATSPTPLSDGSGNKKTEGGQQSVVATESRMATTAGGSKKEAPIKAEGFEPSSKGEVSSQGTQKPASGPARSTTNKTGQHVASSDGLDAKAGGRTNTNEGSSKSNAPGQAKSQSGAREASPSKSNAPGQAKSQSGAREASPSKSNATPDQGKSQSGAREASPSKTNAPGQVKQAGAGKGKKDLSSPATESAEAKTTEPQKKKAGAKGQAAEKGASTKGAAE